jgi:hypothetical protein
MGKGVRGYLLFVQGGFRAGRFSFALSARLFVARLRLRAGLACRLTRLKGKRHEND